MAGVIDTLIEIFRELYTVLLKVLPDNMESGVLVFIFAILITIVALFIWYFYKSLSQRDLLKLNLNQFNRVTHPVSTKLLAVALYFVEYIIVMPFIILVWFSALSIVLLLISEGKTAGNILMLTAAMVAAIRILAYHKKEISQELAKLFPFIALSVFILTPGAFDFEGVFGRVYEIPSLFGNILSFLIVIFAIEIVLRILYTILQFWKSEDIEKGIV